MRFRVLCLALVVAITGCSKESARVSPAAPTLPSRLDLYFERYCDNTAGLGIGFDPSHTYDSRFRQHLKKTPDPELKRLFVLQHLYRDVEFDLNDFKAGIIRTGKVTSRPMTLPEWRSTRQSIQTQIDDLTAFVAFTNFTTVSRDPLDPAYLSIGVFWIEDLRGTLRSVTNAPADNRALVPTTAAP